VTTLVAFDVRNDSTVSACHAEARRRASARSGKRGVSRRERCVGASRRHRGLPARDAERRPACCDGREGRRSVDVIEAIYQASRTGAPVESQDAKDVHEQTLRGDGASRAFGVVAVIR
jgi:hypothetical protein